MIKLGTIVYMLPDIGEGRAFQKLNEMELPTCQLTCWEEESFTDEYAAKVKYAAVKFNIEISAFWCGWGAPGIFDFYDGPTTLGIVPPAYRLARMNTLVKGVEFAHKLGVTDVITHAGFIPENPNDPDYIGIIPVLRHIAGRCKENGQYFLFETGQETPVTLRRAIEDIGLDSVGVNLDPANLLMYGKANPVDALDVLGKYVRGVHAKDGEYPTDGKNLGEEKPLGQGRVNYPALIAKLKEIGYDRPITIEREISGERQIADIIEARDMLRRLIGDGVGRK
ncbi:MAG: sugar phosphate isomerase/epimerase [Firmicutes bacterium]|nr:sugar phosphate isomerase/epimerase [Bacillota bacterium]